MPITPFEVAQAYAKQQGYVATKSIGYGKDGDVFESSALTAIKVHASVHSYQRELRAYQRLLDRGIEKLGIFNVPRLLNFEDGLRLLEIEIEDEGHTLDDLIRDRFGDRAEQVFDLYHMLGEKAGIYPRIPTPITSSLNDSKHAPFASPPAIP